MIRNIDNKKLVVNEYGGIYCFKCKHYFRSRKWAFEHKAPMMCNLCKRLDYWKK